MTSEDVKIDYKNLDDPDKSGVRVILDGSAVLHGIKAEIEVEVDERVRDGISRVMTRSLGE